MRKKGLLAVGSGSVLVLTALILAMTAGAAQTASAKNKDQPSCYPGNEFQIAAGDTEARLDDVKVNSDFSLEPNFTDRSEDTETTGNVTANMHFVVVDGVSLKGWAKVNFVINGKKGRFESKCIAEAQTDVNSTEDGIDVTDQFEVELEGWVKGLPWSEKKQRAIATLSGHRIASGPDTGAIVLNFNVEQGSTCDEYTGEFGSNNGDVPGTTSGDLSADDTDSGRWGVPDRFDPSVDEPCPDVIAG